MPFTIEIQVDTESTPQPVDIAKALTHYKLEKEPYILLSATPRDSEQGGYNVALSFIKLPDTHHIQIGQDESVGQSDQVSQSQVDESLFTLFNQPGHFGALTGGKITAQDETNTYYLVVWADLAAGAVRWSSDKVAIGEEPFKTLTSVSSLPLVDKTDFPAAVNALPQSTDTEIRARHFAERQSFIDHFTEGL